MKITFEWTTGAASWWMHAALKKHGINDYYNRGSMRVFVHGKERAIDYRHVSGDTYEIVEKIYRYRQEPELVDLEF